MRPLPILLAKAVMLTVIFFTSLSWNSLIAQDRDVTSIRHFLTAISSDTLTNSGLSAFIAINKQSKLDSIFGNVTTLKKNLKEDFPDFNPSYIDKRLTERKMIDNFRIFELQLAPEKTLSIAVKDGRIHSLIYSNLSENSVFIYF